MNKKITVGIVAAIVIVVIAAGAYTIGRNNADKKADIQGVASESVEVTPTPSVSQDTTEPKSVYPSVAEADKPVVTVISPNGGEKFQNGNTIEIKWSTKNNVNKTVGIILTRNDGKSVVKEIAGSVNMIPDSGKYSWTIPSDIATGNYKIGVQTAERPAYAYDTSNTNFTIKGTNLNGFEGSTLIVITNSQGVKGYLTANSYLPNGATTLTFTLPIHICTVNLGESGKTCTTFMGFPPGVYKLYVQPWDKPSNTVSFVMMM